MSAKTVKIKRKKPNLRKDNRDRSINPNFVPSLRVVRLRDIMPPRIMTTMKYVSARNLVNAAGVTASMQFNANGIYDIDPSVASTAIPGFNEFIGFYNRYKVHRVKSTCVFINNEAFPILVNMGFEPTPFAANAKTQGYYEMHNQKTALVPRTQTAAGIKLFMIKRGIDVVGDPVVFGSLGYTGARASNPTSLWFVSVSCSTTNTGLPLTAAGITLRWELEFDVEWFETVALNA
jgi:hypothetical protein